MEITRTFILLRSTLMAMVLRGYKRVSVLPVFFLIWSGQVTQISNAEVDVFNNDYPEAKVEDAMSSIEVLEDEPNELKVANKVSSYSVSLKCIFSHFSMA